jgi:hypothetical protein
MNSSEQNVYQRDKGEKQGLAKANFPEFRKFGLSFPKSAKGYSATSTGIAGDPLKRPTIAMWMCLAWFM